MNTLFGFVVAGLMLTASASSMAQGAPPEGTLLYSSPPALTPQPKEGGKTAAQRRDEMRAVLKQNYAEIIKSFVDKHDFQDQLREVNTRMHMPRVSMKPYEPSVFGFGPQFETVSTTSFSTYTPRPASSYYDVLPSMGANTNYMQFRFEGGNGVHGAQ